MKKILVTGGTGAVGKYIVDDLVQHGYQVGVLDLAAPARSDVAHHAVDVLQLDAVVQAMQGYDAVMHVAGIPHPLNDPAKRVFDVNVNGTFNVLEAAAQHGIGKVVFTSSESTMGFAFATHRLAPLYIPVDEAHAARPQDPYGLSKVVSEQICKTYTQRYGMRTVCLRMPWVWLPDDAQRPFYRTLVAEYANWYKNLWTFVDARDVATAHRLALEVDYLPGHEEWIRELAARHPWDYFIGSVHYVSESWDFDNPSKLSEWRKRDAWDVWRVYKMTGPRGGRDIEFLARCFHKLLLNFTWWVNRRDAEGNNIFEGGFLGLDNIGVFDRNKDFTSACPSSGWSCRGSSPTRGTCVPTRRCTRSCRTTPPR